MVLLLFVQSEDLFLVSVSYVFDDGFVSWIMTAHAGGLLSSAVSLSPTHMIA